MKLTIEQIKDKLANQETFDFLVTKDKCPTCEALKNTLDARNIGIETYQWQPTDKLPLKMATAVEAFPTFVRVRNGVFAEFILNPGADKITNYCS